jgi:hypothetical protein
MVMVVCFFVRVSTKTANRWVYLLDVFALPSAATPCVWGGLHPL